MYKDSEKAIEAAAQELRNREINKLCGEFNKEAALVSRDEIMSLFAPERRCSVDRRAAYNHMRMENF